MERNLHIQLSEEGSDAERLDTLTGYLARSCSVWTPPR